MLSGRLLNEYAWKLRTWLKAGRLAGLGAVELEGEVLPLDTATLIALNDFDDLVGQAMEGPPPASRRWRRLSDDIELLHNEAVARLEP